MRIRNTKTLAVIGTIAVVFALALELNTVWRSQQADAESPKEAASSASETGKKAVTVVLTPAKAMAFEQRIAVSGTISASRYALVSARIPGTLDAIFVDEGSPVEAGRTKLFQTDSLKLTKAFAIAQQNLTVAECSVREKQTLLDKTLVGQVQVQSDLNRYQELFKRNAIAAQVVEQQEAQCKQAAADVEHTQSLIDLATAQLEQARLNVTIAQKDLGDSLVVAPDQRRGVATDARAGRDGRRRHAGPADRGPVAAGNLGLLAGGILRAGRAGPDEDAGAGGRRRFG